MCCMFCSVCAEICRRNCLPMSHGGFYGTSSSCGVFFALGPTFRHHFVTFLYFLAPKSRTNSALAPASSHLLWLPPSDLVLGVLRAPFSLVSVVTAPLMACVGPRAIHFTWCALSFAVICRLAFSPLSKASFCPFFSEKTLYVPNFLSLEHFNVHFGQLICVPFKC